MQTAEKAARSITFVVNDDPDGGYTAVARGHDGRSLVTQGDDADDLRCMIRDCVDAAYEPGEAGRPTLIHLHFVRDEAIAA